MKKILRINAKVGNPIIPTNVKDPAGQFGNLRNTNAELNKRYKRIKSAVRTYLNGLNPTLVSNNGSYYEYNTKLVNNVFEVTKGDLVTNVNTYDYQVSATKFNSTSLFLQRLLYGELLDSPQGELTRRWWLEGKLELAYENGTSDALQSAKNIATVDTLGPDIPRTLQAIRLESIIFTPEYQSRVGLVYSRVFEGMKGLTDSTRVDLADTLARGMASGKGVRALSQDVMKRIDVSHSRAKRIVRTEILNSYRTASAAETDSINENVYDDSDWHMTSLWFSALAPTSRPNHVSRHGMTYTTQQVRDFYADSANAINCLCSQSPVLENKKTGEILQEPLQKRMKKQKEIYQKSHMLS